MHEAMIEELAAIEHARWAHWQKYLHAQCERAPDGRLIIPSDLVLRWEEQIGTSYEDLTEREKESDREQVRKILPVLNRYLKTHAE